MIYFLRLSSIGSFCIIAVLLLLTGCSSVPSAHILNISSTRTKVVTHDSRGYLRTFDPATGKWSSRIAYENMKYSSSHYPPSVMSMKKFKDDVIIQIQYGGLYKFNETKGLNFIVKVPYGTLSGIDKDYYYFTAILTDTNKPGWFKTKDYRINKTTLNTESGHLPLHPQLTVVDSKLINSRQLYLCQSINKYDTKDNRDAEWQPYLLIKPIDSEIEDNLIALPTTFQYNVFNRLGWEKFVPSTENGITFRITEKFNSKLCSYDVQKGICCSDEYRSGKSSSGIQLRSDESVVWRLSGSTDNPRRLQGVDTISGERKYFTPPNGVNIDMGSMEHLWGNSIWCSGYRFRTFVGDMPYLVRFNLPDGEAKSFELEPGVFERLETIFGNFLRYFNPVTYLGPG